MQRAPALRNPSTTCGDAHQACDKGDLTSPYGSKLLEEGVLHLSDFGGSMPVGLGSRNWTEVQEGDSNNIATVLRKDMP